MLAGSSFPAWPTEAFHITFFLKSFTGVVGTAREWCEFSAETGLKPETFCSLALFRGLCLRPHVASAFKD